MDVDGFLTGFFRPPGGCNVTLFSSADVCCEMTSTTFYPNPIYPVGSLEQPTATLTSTYTKRIEVEVKVAAGALSSLESFAA